VNSTVVVNTGKRIENNKNNNIYYNILEVANYARSTPYIWGTYFE
jgi:hypothetical protein